MNQQAASHSGSSHSSVLGISCARNWAVTSLCTQKLLFISSYWRRKSADALLTYMKRMCSWFLVIQCVENHSFCSSCSYLFSCCACINQAVWQINWLTEVLLPTWFVLQWIHEKLLSTFQRGEKTLFHLFIVMLLCCANLCVVIDWQELMKVLGSGYTALS